MGRDTWVKQVALREDVTCLGGFSHFTGVGLTSGLFFFTSLLSYALLEYSFYEPYKYILYYQESSASRCFHIPGLCFGSQTSELHHRCTFS
jgi:hypothetical protein